MKIKKDSLYNLLLIIIVLFTILLSKTQYFGKVYKSTYQWIYYCVVLIPFLFAKRDKTNYKESFIYGFCLLILLLFNIFIYFTEMTSSQVNYVLGIALTILAVLVTIYFVSIEKFAYYYIKIMNIICIISIICFVIALINPNLALKLCQPGYSWMDDVGYSWFHTWGGVGKISTRNYGPFWEPGAFQGFIVVGLLFLLFNVDNNIKSNRVRSFLLYSVTILTTQSSTGYIILIILFLSQLRNIKNNIFGERLNKIFIIFSIILFVPIIVLGIGTGVIGEKLLFSDGKFQTVSAFTRFNDLIGGISLIGKGNLFGIGVTPSADSLKALYNVNISDSVGLFSMIYTFGLLFGTIYIISLFRGIKSIFAPKRLLDIFVLSIVFIILHMTEGLWFLPVYLYLCLARKKIIVQRG